MVGNDEQRALPWHVAHTAKVKVMRPEKRKRQEPYRARENEIPQPGLSTFAESIHHLLEDLMDRLTLGLDDYSIGCRTQR